MFGLTSHFFSSNEKIGLKRYFVFLSLIWTLLLVFLHSWYSSIEFDYAHQLVLNKAKAHFNKDQAFRFWGSLHGGVYVPPTEKTPPNPYLSHIPDRDIETLNGKKLTLMNPAYMVRQLMEDFSELYDVRGRITSLNPLRPENAPDEWEKQALQQFETGVQEVSELTEINGTAYLRFMQPMIVQESCLKCHGHQGYVVGDVRGGVGVSVNASSFFEAANRQIIKSSILFLLIWIIGITGLLLSSIRINYYLKVKDSLETYLKHEQLRLHSTIKGTNLGTWEWNVQTGELVFNERWASMLGFSLNDLQPIGIKTWETLTHPEDLKLAKEKLHDHFQNKSEFYDIEIRMKHKNGHWIWIHDRGQVITWTNDEKPLMMYGTHSDVTDRKIIEDALKESERRFKAIANNMPGVVYQCYNDERYTMLYINDQVEKITGYPKEDYLDHQISFVDLYHPDDVSNITKQVNTALDNKEPFHIIYRIRHRDGDWKWIEEYGVGVFFDEKLRYIEGILIDITKRKYSENERERLFTAIQQTNDTIVITDAEGTIQYVNPSFEHVTGYSSQEVLGQNPRILKSGKQDDHFYEALWEKLISGDTWNGRLINKKKDESLFTEDATISPIRDESGRITNYVAVKRDITKVIELEDKYRQSQKMETIGRLAGGVAHDFNNMLGVILGYTELALSEMKSDDTLFQEMSAIQSAGRRSAELTKQLLAFARKQPIHPVVMNLNEVIEGMYPFLQRAVGENISIKWNFGEPVWNIKIDPIQIEQILTNLCLNSRDAINGNGTISIFVANEKLDKPIYLSDEEYEIGDYVCISLSDTGCGMTNDELNLIFEPFYTNKKNGKGTGLGLPMIYGIVKQNKGYIDVISEQKVGSTFKIFLPRCYDPLTDMETGIKTESLVNGTETVLVVEDEPYLLEMTSTFLKKLGYTVFCAKNPSDAIAVVENCDEKIDLLITDVILPEMNGKELSLKIQEKKPEMLCLFVSGYTSEILTKQTILDSNTNFMQKPFKFNELAKKVREVLTL